ncbi:XRE family transcriptional regulator [Luteimonas sp. RD2P54]|uniref:XRE family transcriptional regulator n=1 Tax=Luteimonas endophytica TaxID=3042023 RepID=A0ABT6JBM2_9GAMM|nr:XRE family transcriptional regulator [Luteimonas endophytica]MDH5824204.1 XRE family transcriptional regulator [Luteimonas endophytica]
MNAVIERLISARKAAGVSQEDAARKLEMSRPTYIAIEKGDREVKPRELIALASLFKTTVNHLVRQQSAPPRISPHLRAEIAKHPNASVDEAINKLTKFVDDYQFLLEKTNARQIDVSIPETAKSQMPVDRLAAHAAQDARNRLGLGEREPIGNLRKTLDEVGVHVIVDSLDSKLAGLYSFVEGFGYCILVNRKHPRERMRWTVAHEFGHFLHDRDKPGIDYLQGPVRKPTSERFADAFAACFLMPEAGVKRQFDDAMARAGDVNVGDVCRIADFYGVSMMAMTLRLEALGLVRKGTWNLLKSSGVKVSDIKREAGIAEGVKVEELETYPERYILLAIQAWTSEVISTSQFASLVGRSPIEARELAAKRSSSVVECGEALEEISLRLSDSVLERARTTE